MLTRVCSCLLSLFSTSSKQWVQFQLWCKAFLVEPFLALVLFLFHSFLLKSWLYFIHLWISFLIYSGVSGSIMSIIGDNGNTSEEISSFLLLNCLSLSNYPQFVSVLLILLQHSFMWLTTLTSDLNWISFFIFNFFLLFIFHTFCLKWYCLSSFHLFVFLLFLFNFFSDLCFCFLAPPNQWKETANSAWTFVLQTNKYQQLFYQL